VLKRVSSSQHLQNHDSQTVVVHRVRVLLVSDDLRRQVLSCAAKRARLAAFLVQAVLAEPEISKPDMPLVVNQNILGLQIPIHNALLVQVLKRKHNLRGIELGPLLDKVALLGQMEEELAAIHEVHDQVQVLGVLKGEKQLHNEGVVQSFKQLSLS